MSPWNPSIWPFFFLVETKNTLLGYIQYRPRPDCALKPSRETGQKVNEFLAFRSPFLLAPIPGVKSTVSKSVICFQTVHMVPPPQQPFLSKHLEVQYSAGGDQR